MTLKRYRPRHLKPQPPNLAPVAIGTAAATLWMASPAAAGSYKVRPGDTLSAIALRYKTSVTSLARANSIENANYVVAGQRLSVPGSGGGGRMHEVRPGETLSDIAARHGVSVAGLAKVNDIADPNLIVAGQRIRIKGGGSGSAPAARAATASPGDVGASIERHARSHGVDPALVKAVAWQESGWNQRAVSSAGAIGVMQVMPDTADYVNAVLTNHNLDVRSMDDNVHLGVTYLKRMIDTMPSLKKALAAYYSGPGNVGRRLNAGQRAYARNVLALRNRF